MKKIVDSSPTPEPNNPPTSKTTVDKPEMNVNKGGGEKKKDNTTLIVVIIVIIIVIGVLIYFNMQKNKANGIGTITGNNA